MIKSPMFNLKLGIKKAVLLVFFGLLVLASGVKAADDDIVPWNNGVFENPSLLTVFGRLRRA